MNRLLASDAYAEQMTLVWMDAARYGDTSVFHDDGREYVAVAGLGTKCVQK